MNLSLELWDQAESYRYSSIEAELEDLSFGTMLGVGFADCSFNLRRSPRLYQADIAPTNLIVIRAGRKVAWKGEIIAPVTQVQDAITTPVEADGLGYRLATRANTAAFSSGQASTWITANLIGDTDLAYAAGSVDTGDYNFPYGVDLFPVSHYADSLDKFNKCNGYFYGVWEDGFHWEPYPATAQYEVRAEDAKYELSYSIEEIENCLYVSYTADGSLYKYFWYPNSDMVNYTGTAVPDADSEALYKRRDGILAVPGKASRAQAATMAAVTLAEKKRMRPQSSFTVTRVTDALTGQEVPLPLVRAGALVHIRDIYPTRMNPTEMRIINELSTFEIAETSYNVATGELTISPGTMGLMMEKMLARIEARTAT